MIPQISPFLVGYCIPEITKYLKSDAWLVEHQKTKEFEEHIKKFLDVKYVILTTSGTTALALACMATLPDVQNKKANQILVSDYTMVASAHAPLLASWAVYPYQLEIKLIDIESDNLCMDTNLAISEIKKGNVRGVIYTSLNGRCGDIKELHNTCKEYKIPLIEDACQSFGSRYKDKYLGTIGDVGCFSLSPQKIITTGQGGIIVTDNDEIAQRIRKLKDHGRIQPGKDEFDSLGFNFKYTDLQAIIGMEQMQTIDWRRKQKKYMYNQYYRMLWEFPFLLILKNSDETVPWFVDIYSPIKNKVIQALEDFEIGYKVVYPALHTQYPYNNFHTQSDWLSSQYCSTGIWLPSGFDVSPNTIDRVYTALKGVR